MVSQLSAAAAAAAVAAAGALMEGLKTNEKTSIFPDKQPLAGAVSCCGCLPVQQQQQQQERRTHQFAAAAADAAAGASCCKCGVFPRHWIGFHMESEQQQEEQL